MDKIASPPELQAEIRRIQAWVHNFNGEPRRNVVSALLRNLAFRVAGDVMAVDQAAMHDLELYMENERSLYNQKMSIIQNIQRRMKKDQYNPALAPKLWMYWVDAGAKAYIKENAPGARVQDMFPKPLREALAKQFAKDYEEQIRNGEYD